MVGDILQPTHLLFVLVVALLVLGPKRLPEVARTLGKGIRDFRGAISGEPDRDEDPRSFLPREGEPGHYETTEPTPPAPAAAVAPPSPESAAATAPVAPAQPAPQATQPAPVQPAPVQPEPAPPVPPAPGPADPAAAHPAQPAAAEPAHAEPAHPEHAPAPSGDGEHSSAGAAAQHSE